MKHGSLWRPGCQKLRILPTFVACALSLSACTETLVYGERSGFNLAIRSDVAESAPLEVNAGLQRRVIGIIPARGERFANRPNGEAVNMFAGFNIHYDENSDRVFGGKLTVGSSFASGEAALAISKSVALVEKVTNGQFEATNVALTKYIAQGDINIQAYLDVAESLGIQIPKEGDNTSKAFAILDDPNNREKNITISQLLGLT